MHHVLVEQGGTTQHLAEILPFRQGGQTAVYQEIGHLHKAAMFGQILNGVTTVAENALFPVQKGDIAGTGTGVHIAGIKGDQTGLRSQGTDIQGLLPLGANDHRQLVNRIADREGRLFAGHEFT